MGRFLSMCEGRGSVGMVGIGYTIEPNPTTYTCKLNIEVCSVPDKFEHLRMCVRVAAVVSAGVVLLAKHCHLAQKRSCPMSVATDSPCQKLRDKQGLVHRAERWLSNASPLIVMSS